MGAYLSADHRARRARICRYLAFAGVVLIAPFFFIGGPGWTDGPLYKSAWNLGHILFFALLTLAVRPWRIWAGWTLWGLTTLAVLLVGIGIELLQYGVDRQMDWQDILRNLLGLWAVLALQPTVPQKRLSWLTTWCLRVVVAALVTIEVGSTARVAVQQYLVSQLLPALYDFNQADPSPFWKGPVEPARASADNGEEGQLRISLSTNRYSGVSLHNFPGDWRNYERLVIVLRNPQDNPLRLNLRVNDLAHDLGDNAYNDRFNTPLVLPPGEHTFRLDLERIADAPDDRNMDMRNIRRLGLFASRLPEPATVFLQDIRLE